MALFFLAGEDHRIAQIGLIANADFAILAGVARIGPRRVIATFAELLLAVLLEMLLACLLLGRKLSLGLTQKTRVMLCVLQKILGRNAVVRKLGIAREDQILLDDLLRRATDLAFRARAVEDTVDNITDRARAVRFRTRTGFRGSHLVL